MFDTLNEQGYYDVGEGEGGKALIVLTFRILLWRDLIIKRAQPQAFEMLIQRYDRHLGKSRERYKSMCTP